MKVLILNAPYGKNFCRSARWAARSRARVQRHPDWLLIAAAVLEQHGHVVLFFDGAALNFPKEKILAEARSFKPELAVIHTTTPTIYSDIEYARELKEHTGSKTILVGAHVTAEPDNTLQIADGCVDHIVIGEYDTALLQIASGKTTDCIVRAPVDIDALPFPAWHHIDPYTYMDFGKRYPFLTLLSGRGCHGHCTFCTNPQTIAPGLRFRDPRAVVDEIEYDFRLFPFLKEIMFETDTFTASAKHVTGICEEILRRNLKITFSVNTRVDMDLSLLPLMKRAGCRMLMVGFEFGTREALDSVRKGITIEQSRKFASEADHLGFTIHGCFMFGAPGETPESARKTIEFAKSLPLDTAQFSGICVYPGTHLYKEAKAQGVLAVSDWSEWVDEKHEQVTLLDYPQFSRAQIDDCINRGLKEFYLRPRQVVRMLTRANEWPDLVRKARGMRSFFGSVFGVE
jgi:anaerobic magnesium-protoporphyrin IX monomethyl ester cyclase